MFVSLNLFRDCVFSHLSQVVFLAGFALRAEVIDGHLGGGGKVIAYCCRNGCAW